MSSSLEVPVSHADLAKRWYIVHTYSGFEEKARAALLERVKTQKVEHKFGEVFVPRTTSEQILKSGKKKQVVKTSFPGYILIQMAFDDESSALVRGTPKITGFVGNARNPSAVPEHEVLRITNPETMKPEDKNMMVAESRFKRGDTVKVKDGPFSNFDGVVDEVKTDKMKLRIIVKILGRETPVDLDFNQVDKG